MERSTWLKARLQFVDGKAPDQSIAKHLKMATSPFYFFRGSASVFYADIHSNHLSLPNELLSIPLTTIMGDCHVSNFGFISEEGAHGETLIFAPNDFDDACIGHAAWDLLRYLVSLHLAQQEGVRLKQEFINDQSPDREKDHVKVSQVQEAMHAFIQSYMEYCQSSLAGHITSQSALLAFSEKHILFKRWQKGLQRLSDGAAFLTKSTLAKEIDCFSFPLKFKEDDSKFRRLDQPTDEEIRNVFAPYVSDEILDIVERIDAGTGSNNMLRYYLLVGPKHITPETLSLCYIVEVKQQREAAPLHFFPQLCVTNRLNPAHLTVHCQRRMQRRPDLILDDALWQGQHYLIRSRHHARVGIDPEHFTLGKRAAIKDGFTQYAQTCGEALALAHMRGDRRSLAFQQQVVDVLPRYIDKLVDMAIKYADQVSQDHALLVEMLSHRIDEPVVREN
ncbi:DUF2252 family protein [Pseudoalteromonas xiamenensis]|uniref:DUF2252 family protein n=1 Tax=Pseudoalteromonas xiamenensis TaxID=882626 RepID=UPI0035E804F4